jgi:uncharacterized membrane protein
MPPSSKIRRPPIITIVSATVVVLAGALAVAFQLASVLSHSGLASEFMSAGLWRQIVVALGGTISGQGDNQVASLPSGTFLVASAGFALVTWLAGAVCISRRRQIPYVTALSQWGRSGWIWWISVIGWELLAVVWDLCGVVSLQALWHAVLPFWHSTMGAGWLTTFFVFTRPRDAALGETNLPDRIPASVWFAAAAYFACFALMNCLLYEALLLPHGDSAMYEEHVWNLLHGKGFRSYLDQGRPFLGEHIQVIHLAVIPLYVLWPSHLLLELGQSAWLAAGAIPVFRIAQRHSGSRRGAILLAIAYLLYFPMQYLDIAVTFKTFRPNSFEIPFVMFAIDALERSRYSTLLIWLGLSLLCQEDAATIIAPLGVWIALRQARFAGITDRTARRNLAWLGSGLAVFGVVYVALVVKVVLPWFRGGADVHFAKYFDEFGGDSNAIVSTVLNHPGLFLTKLCGAPSWLFALGLLAPLGFLPLLSPGRLAVAAPLFGVLCLSNMTNSPLHHFHAPLVPIVVWAAAAGLPLVGGVWRRCVVWRNRRQESDDPDDERKRIAPERFVSSGKTLPSVQPSPLRRNVAPRYGVGDARTIQIALTASVWCVLCALFSGSLMSLSPLGIGFWDPYSSRYWRDHYVLGERARRFPVAFALVPQDSRVASTDYIHPRFTHHARSYDYSHYRPDVPADADFIVIDTQHPYSEIKRPRDIKEFHEHPDQWELLEDNTGGYFIVLKRRR